MAKGVYQANYECTWYNCYVAPPLKSWKQLKPGSVESCKPIVFLGKLVGIDYGFSLAEDFQCVIFTVQDIHFNCSFGIVFALQVS